MKQPRLTLILAFILLSCFFGGCKAQPAKSTHPAAVDDSVFFVDIDTSFAFINYDSSHLIIPGDSTSLRRFAEKWYTMLATGEGHISIMQIGASHIQGGSLPHRLRYNLITASGMAADRGLIFPYSAAQKCNNPYDYRIRRSRPLELTRNVYKEPLVRLGLCGISVTARDSTAEVGFFLNEPNIDFATSRIVLLGETSDSVIPQIKVWNSPDDSITLQPETVDPALRTFSYRCPLSVDSFTVIIPCKNNQSFSLTGIYLANDGHGISYHSIGVNGATVSDYLNKCPYFNTDLQLVKPDLVIFCIGINDASGDNFDTTVFARRYLKLVDSIRSVNPDCALLFVTNNDSYRRLRRKQTVNANAPLAREAFLHIAQATGGAVWDQFTVMGGLESMKKWSNAGLAQRDLIHFTRKGYELLADMLTNAIAETLIQLKPDGIVTTHQQRSTKNNQSDKKDRNTSDERHTYISY